MTTPLSDGAVATAIAADQAARLTIETELGRTLFVEAGAGTGKTTELVDRITQLVLHGIDGSPVPLASIAAITFTEAAAAELRERIRSEFEGRLRAANEANEESMIARCTQALEEADIAAISTLHAFARRLLSEFPIEVGIPPRVEVIDEVRSQVAFDERWSNFIDELFADPDVEEFVVRASILGVGLGSDGSPLRTVAKIFEDNWDRFGDDEIAAPIAAPVDWSKLERPIHEVIDALDWCTDADDKLYVKVQKQCETFRRFLGSTHDIERLRLLEPITNMKASAGRAPSWSERKQDFVELHQVMTAAAEAVRADLANQTLTLLAARIARFTRDAAHERCAEGELEYHDLLVLARQLLRQSPEARAALSQRYHVLMLDEFQDTDPIQIELALLLAGSTTEVFDGKWTELTADPGRLFMVGDPKQSIYRFRRADIALFLDVQETFADGLVQLTQNFRTVAPVLDAINALFAVRMAEATAGQPRYVPLTPTRQPSTIDHRPVVLGGAMEGSTAAEIREAEAADVASAIDHIRRKPSEWLVGERNDAGVDGWREPKLSDITILLPTRTSLIQLSAALNDREIPFRSDTGTLVYETQEVRELLSVLRAIDDPSDQIALVAALRSGLYACGDDDLYHWRRRGGVWDFRMSVPDELAGGTVDQAMQHLRSLADRRWWDEPSALLLRIIEDRRVFAVAGADRNRRDRWRRLRYLVDQARAFAEADGGDLRDYLRWAALQGFDGARAHEPMLPEPDDDAVRIMTVHGSKGLEFPITIVSGLTTALSGTKRGVEVDWSTGKEIPEVKLNKSLRTAQFDVGSDLEAEMDAEEKERLLYVALTRARDHLIVSGYHPLTAKGAQVKCHGATISTFATGAGADLIRPLDSVAKSSVAKSSVAKSSAAQGTLFDAPPATAVGVGVRDGVPSPAPIAVPSVEEWTTTRTALLGRAARPHVLSATAIATSLQDTSLEDQATSVRALDDDSEPWIDDDADALPPTTFRRGRAGTAIGSAVHAVLQFVDLAAPDDRSIDELVSAQAWAESVPEFRETIRASVDSALAAPIVRACSTSRHWKELFVAAPVGEVTIEGYVDLLVEQPEGLVVVDYKTDSVSSDDEVDEKLDRYVLQGAAYALAIETATGQNVAEVQFVFTRPGGPVVRSIPDLDIVMERVRSIS